MDLECNGVIRVVVIVVRVGFVIIVGECKALDGKCGVLGPI